MYRLATRVAVLLCASVLVGCDSGGIKEGPPPEPIGGGQSESFKETMSKQGDLMQMKNQQKTRVPGKGNAAPDAAAPK